MTPEPFVEVFMARTNVQAHVLRIALEGRGITVLLEGENLQNLFGGVRGVFNGEFSPRLKVPASQEAEAREILERIVRGSGGDDDAQD